MLVGNCKCSHAGNGLFLYWVCPAHLGLHLDPLTWGHVCCYVGLHSGVNLSGLICSSRECTQTFSLFLDWCIDQCGCTLIPCSVNFAALPVADWSTTWPLTSPSVSPGLLHLFEFLCTMLWLHNFIILCWPTDLRLCVLLSFSGLALRC